jgi:hypothetical protein
MTSVMGGGRTILWRWVDRPGHEAARLSRQGEDWLLEGAAAFRAEDQACGLSYRIWCDQAWRTRTAEISGWVGDTAIAVRIEVVAEGVWTLNGEPVDAVKGSIDIDLNFSPSTNLLPIRRLELRVGQREAVRAAWMRFPSFELEPLEQTYERLAANLYRYRSGDGRFQRDLTVDDQGFVIDYPGIWRAEEAVTQE